LELLLETIDNSFKQAEGIIGVFLQNLWEKFQSGYNRPIFHKIQYIQFLSNGYFTFCNPGSKNSVDIIDTGFAFLVSSSPFFNYGVFKEPFIVDFFKKTENQSCPVEEDEILQVITLKNLSSRK